MIESPQEGAFQERRRLGERRRLEERRLSGERRRMMHRRRGDEPAFPKRASHLGGERPAAKRAETLPTEQSIRLEALLDLCEALSPESAPQIIHELRLHKAELERQNEELRRERLDLEITKRRYLDRYDQAPVGYCTLDERSQILDANLTMATLLGEERCLLARTPFSGFIHPEDQGIYERQLQLLLQDREPQTSELRMQKRDGTALWAHLDATLARDVEGQSICRLVITDITAYKQMEYENRQLQKRESLGRMAGAIAHLFNNQIQAVMASLDMLGEHPGSGGHARYVSIGKRACERAAEVSQLMLVYLGLASARREPCHLSELCLGCQNLLQGILPSSVQLETEYPSPGPLVSANPEQVRQVLMHLFKNACEALGGSRGSVRLDVRTCPAAEIPEAHRFPVDWKPQDPNYACLEVRDTGCGIIETDLEKLFDPFFTTKFSGRGLGLPMALGIAQAHGGGLTVASQIGRGSIFRVYLPALPGE